MEENLNDKTRAKVWEFPSSSGSKTYHTVQYTDGFISCNCRGWTMKKKNATERYCRHKDMVTMGTADDNCIACKDLQVSTAAPAPVQTVTKKVKKKKKAAPKAVESSAPIVRKISW